MHTIEGIPQFRIDHAKKVVARIGRDWPTFWQEMRDMATPQEEIAPLFEMAVYEDNARLVRHTSGEVVR